MVQILTILTSNNNYNFIIINFEYSPTAIGKLAHKDGEIALAKAAHATNILQMIPIMASYSLEVFFIYFMYI